MRRWKFASAHRAGEASRKGHEIPLFLSGSSHRLSALGLLLLAAHVHSCLGEPPYAHSVAGAETCDCTPLVFGSGAVFLY